MREAFATRLKKALEDNSMNPDILIIKSGLDKFDIVRYLNGSSVPRQKKLIILAKVLKVTPEWLLGCDVGGEIEVLRTYADADLTIEEFNEIWSFALKIKNEKKNEK